MPETSAENKNPTPATPKKALPKDFEQISLKRYREKQELERTKNKKKAKLPAPVALLIKIFGIICAVFVAGVVLYWGYCLLTPQPK